MAPSLQLSGTLYPLLKTTVTMKCRKVIKVVFFYFNLYLCVMLDSFSDAGEACMLHLKIGKLTIVKSRSSAPNLQLSGKRPLARS
jgi:hypothetical protein